MERLADRAILGRKSPPNGRGQIGPDAKTRVLPPRRQLSVAWRKAGWQDAKHRTGDPR